MKGTGAIELVSRLDTGTNLSRTPRPDSGLGSQKDLRANNSTSLLPAEALDSKPTRRN